MAYIICVSCVCYPNPCTGATFELTPKEKGMSGAIAKATELVQTIPNACTHPSLPLPGFYHKLLYQVPASESCHSCVCVSVPVHVVCVDAGMPQQVSQRRQRIDLECTEALDLAMLSVPNHQCLYLSPRAACVDFRPPYRPLRLCGSSTTRPTSRCTRGRRPRRSSPTSPTASMPSSPAWARADTSPVRRNQPFICLQIK